MKNINVTSLILAFIILLSSYPSYSYAKTTVNPQTVTIFQTIKDNKDLSIFAKYVEKAGLKKMLSNTKSKITVFVPTNSAIKKIPSKILKKIKKNKANRKKFVLYHIIKNSMIFSTNIRGRRASPSTATGEMIGFNGIGKKLKVGKATITKTDIRAKNGVIHIIDKTLISPSFTKTKKLMIDSPKPPNIPNMPTIKTKTHEEKKESGIKKMFKKLFNF